MLIYQESFEVLFVCCVCVKTLPHVRKPTKTCQQEGIRYYWLRKVWSPGLSANPRNLMGEGGGWSVLMALRRWILHSSFFVFLCISAKENGFWLLVACWTSLLESLLFSEGEPRGKARIWCFCPSGTWRRVANPGWTGNLRKCTKLREHWSYPPPFLCDNKSTSCCSGGWGQATPFLPLLIEASCERSVLSRSKQAVRELWFFFILRE